jgi:hypothetical protein
MNILCKINHQSDICYNEQDISSRDFTQYQKENVKMEQIPSNTPVMPSPVSSGNERIMAIASMVVGVINLCAWFIPICGIPLSLVGIVLGFLGMKDETQKTFAIIGIALCAIGLILGCGNAAYGVYLGYISSTQYQ